MKKYTKPTAKVIELSVKESLSKLPDGYKFGGITKNEAGRFVTTYDLVASFTSAC